MSTTKTNQQPVQAFGQRTSGQEVLFQLLKQRQVDAVWVTPNALYHIDRQLAPETVRALQVAHAKSVGLFGLADAASGRAVSLLGHISEYADLLPALWQAFLLRVPLQLSLLYADQPFIFPTPIPLYQFVDQFREQPLGVMSHASSLETLIRIYEKIVPAAEKLRLSSTIFLPLSVFHSERALPNVKPAATVATKPPAMSYRPLPPETLLASQKVLDGFDLTPYLQRLYMEKTTVAVLASGMLAERLNHLLKLRRRAKLDVPALLYPEVVAPLPISYIRSLKAIERFHILNDPMLPFFRSLPEQYFPDGSVVVHHTVGSHIELGRLEHLIEEIV